jgi:hypothetical protein
MKSIIADILRNQAETLRKGLGDLPYNLYLLETVLPDGLPGEISYEMVIEELEKLAHQLENE